MRVENDRIEVVSFPGPDRSVTIEGLKNYRVSNRRYRNRRIGDFLKELHLTEGRNTGFKKIIDALDVNGSPKPEFETDEERTYFIARFFVHDCFKIDDNEVGIENNSIQLHFNSIGFAYANFGNDTKESNYIKEKNIKRFGYHYACTYKSVISNERISYSGICWI